jgi:FkbM family methyltransferase
MKSTLIQLAIRWYRFLFARRQFYSLNRFLHTLSLRGIGVLNFENDRVSGEDHFLTSYLRDKPGCVVFDVGANNGRYGEKVMRLQPNARVYAFEPHPGTFTRLQESAVKHGFHAFNLGCGDTRTETLLFDYAGGQGTQHASVHENVFTGIHEQKPIGHRIQIITLDDFVIEYGLQSVDLVKIDVEGNEFSVLRGLQKSLSQGRINAIQFEFNTMNVVSRVFFKDFVDLLKGFALYRLLPNGLAALPHYDPALCEIFAFQNIVALREMAGKAKT